MSEDELLYKLLENRGVTDPKRFLNLDESCIHDGMLMRNMSEGLELFHKHVKDKNRIHVQVDSDGDGLTSAAFIINYIRKLNKRAKITYTLHTGKQHGIILDLLKDYDFDLLIVPDAGTNDIEQSKMLSEQGKSILILDHHDIEVVNQYATVINCKDGQYPNPTLSGCGVVYKFCKEYDKKYGLNFADSMLELVAVGMIGDSMDLRNFETRYLTLKGLERLNNGYNQFFQEIIKRNEYQFQGGINITKVGWYLVPLLNAVIRSGSAEEKLDTFKALLGEQETREYTPRKTKNNPNPKVESQTLQEFMARQISNIKSRQDREVKKGVEKLHAKIEGDKLDKNKILIVDGTNELDQTFTGLVANKLASEYKRPVILLREFDKNTYGGSGRNYSLSAIENLREFLQEQGTFDEILGHSNAFGFKINKEKINETIKKANEALKDVEIDDVYLCDFEIPVGRLKPFHIKQVGQWEHIWGGSNLEEPLFAITNIYIPTENIQLLGERKNFIRFEARGVTFIKKYTNEDEYNRMILKQSRGLNKKAPKSIKLDIVGKFKLNTWEENVHPQVEIVAWNSVDGSSFIF